MSTTGPDIYTALLSVRRLHQQVALLLRTADAHMVGEEGFQALCGATALADGTSSIHQPDKWLPNTAFRYYQRKGAEDIVAFASVIMCPRGPEHHKLGWTEPLVSAGWLRLAEPVTKWNQYGWANMIVWTDVPRDGTLSRWVAPPRPAPRERQLGAAMPRGATGGDLDDGGAGGPCPRASGREHGGGSQPPGIWRRSGGVSLTYDRRPGENTGPSKRVEVEAAGVGSRGTMNAGSGRKWLRSWWKHRRMTMEAERL